ncbi:flagellar basal-body rod modification protein FlgD [Ruegeria halocynthiae]|uniref:Basal-body rod modification protein FlgD n=1 Tax=Ruegeria halocynthiae TaxID=985054 RepID=A0A1H3BX96_9RHOB|nr:flagellar hook capping FlgD N-terminal domain-containing protein [Ruegeria halocynthiae]SDX46486.1 flagellar basal-body rod modification protein FlgD [Ruegeria halocynthiae]
MITPTNSAAATAAGPNAGSNTQRSALTSDFETFLRMLTVQARNQDPLEPLDSSEYASQLAQFSMVEQQVKANELLSGLAVTLGAVNLNQLTGWVGMNVQTTAPFRFEDQAIAISAQAEPDADRAELVIQDDQGAVVDRITVPTDKSEFEWAGVNGAGDPLPAGTYAASLDSYKNGKLLSNTPASVFGRVVEAQVSEGAVILKLDSGVEVPVERVTQIRTGA